MKKLFLLLAILGIYALPATAQNNFFNTILLSGAGRPISGATITVCTYSASDYTNTPPTPWDTYHGTIPCTATVSIFADSASVTPQANPFLSDGLGNLTFWASAPLYTVCVTGPAVTGYCSPMQAGGGGGGGGSCSLDAIVPGTITASVLDVSGAGAGYVNGDTGYLFGGNSDATYTITNAIAGAVQPGGYTLSAAGTRYTAQSYDGVATSGSGTGLLIDVTAVTTGTNGDFLYNNAGTCGGTQFYYSTNNGEAIFNGVYDTGPLSQMVLVAPDAISLTRNGEVESSLAIDAGSIETFAGPFATPDQQFFNLNSGNLSFTDNEDSKEAQLTQSDWNFTDSLGNPAGGFTAESPGAFSSVIALIGDTSFEQVSLVANNNTAFGAWCLPAANGTAGQAIVISASNTGCGGTQLEFAATGGIGGTVTSPHIPFANGTDTISNMAWEYAQTASNSIDCLASNTCGWQITDVAGDSIEAFANTGINYLLASGKVFSATASTLLYNGPLINFASATRLIVPVTGAVTETGDFATDANGNFAGWNGGFAAKIPFVNSTWTDGDCAQLSVSGGQYSIADSGVAGCGTGGGGGSVTSIATSAPITGGTITTAGTIGCATCVTSAASLTNHAIVLGAGSQATSALGSLGTTTTLLHGNASGAPSFGAVVLSTDVSGQLPIAAVGSAGLSGTSPIVVASTGAISCPTCSVSSGTVSSVALTMPAIFSVGGSPITSSGTLAVTLGTESANTFFAGPTTGAAATPTFRAIVGADVPTLNQNTTGNAATATALAATPSQCSGVNFSTGIAANGNANCSSPFGSLFYQTVALNGTSQTQRPTLNFTSVFTATDSASPARTTIGLGTVPVSNGGTGQTSLTAHSILAGNGTSAVTQVPVPSDSQVYYVTQTGSTDPTTLLPGIDGRSVSGTSDTLVSADRGQAVVYTSASSVSVSAPAPGTTGFGSFWETNLVVTGAGGITVTPTSGTINGGGSASAVQGNHCTIAALDNTNYSLLCSPGIVSGGNNISLTSSAYGTTVATSAANVQDCGTTTTCGHTALTTPFIVTGSVALGSGTPSTATITGFSPAFTSTSTYNCTATEVTNAANNLLSVTKVSASSITITGPNTITDTVAYTCIGH